MILFNLFSHRPAIKMKLCSSYFKCMQCTSFHVSFCACVRVFRIYCVAVKLDAKNTDVVSVQQILSKAAENDTDVHVSAHGYG